MRQRERLDYKKLMGTGRSKTITTQKGVYTSTRQQTTTLSLNLTSRNISTRNLFRLPTPLQKNLHHHRRYLVVASTFLIIFSSNFRSALSSPSSLTSSLFSSVLRYSRFRVPPTSHRLQVPRAGVPSVSVRGHEPVQQSSSSTRRVL